MSGEQGRYTLSELAAASGISARTIRYYTAEGLLPPPGERGRYAIYSVEHLRRLELIGRLKAAYLPLAAIRERLSAPGETFEPGMPPPIPEASSAAGFGFRVSAQLGAEGMPAARPPSQSTATGYAALFPYPDEAEPSTGGESGDLWLRVELAPGVELHLRTPIAAGQRERLDRLIADARALLNDN